MAHTDSLLKFEIDRWEQDARVYYHANCYNYAINVIDSKYSGGAFIPELKPGEMAIRRRLWPDQKRIRREIKRLRNPESLLQMMFDPRRFETYAATRIRLFTDDGLRFLGTEQFSTQGGYPVALFFREIGKDSLQWFRRMDYHWYVLRQDEAGRSFWGCKFLNGGVKVLAGKSIFTDAISRGYNHFAGYFLRPDDMDV